MMEGAEIQRCVQSHPFFRGHIPERFCGGQQMPKARARPNERVPRFTGRTNERNSTYCGRGDLVFQLPGATATLLLLACELLGFSWGGAGTSLGRRCDRFRVRERAGR